MILFILSDCKFENYIWINKENVNNTAWKSKISTTTSAIWQQNSLQLKFWCCFYEQHSCSNGAWKTSKHEVRASFWDLKQGYFELIATLWELILLWARSFYKLYPQIATLFKISPTLSDELFSSIYPTASDEFINFSFFSFADFYHDSAIWKRAFMALAASKVHFLILNPRLIFPFSFFTFHLILYLCSRKGMKVSFMMLETRWRCPVQILLVIK